MAYPYRRPDAEEDQPEQDSADTEYDSVATAPRPAARPLIRPEQVFDFKTEPIDPRGFTVPAVRQMFAPSIRRAERAANLEAQHARADQIDADRAERAAKAEERAQEKDRKAAQEEEKKRVNAIREADYKTRGVEHYTDAYGMIVPARHADGRERFAVGEDGRKVIGRSYDDHAGYQRTEVDAFGQVHHEDDNRYQVFPDEPLTVYRGGPKASKVPGDKTGWQPQATLAEAAKSDSPALRAAAQTGRAKLDERLAGQAVGEAERLKAGADLELDQWRADRAAKEKRLKEITAEQSALSEVAKEKAGGFIGIGKRPTPNAEDAQKRIGELQREEGDLRTALGPEVTEETAISHDPAAQALVHQRKTLGDQIDAFKAILESEGGAAVPGALAKAERRFADMLPEGERESHPILSKLRTDRDLLKDVQTSSDPQAREKTIAAWEAHPDKRVNALATKARAIDAKAASASGAGVTSEEQAKAIIASAEADNALLIDEQKKLAETLKAEAESRQKVEKEALAQKKLAEAKGLTAARQFMGLRDALQWTFDPTPTANNVGLGVLRAGDVVAKGAKESGMDKTPLGWVASLLTPNIADFGADLGKAREVERLTDEAVAAGKDPAAARSEVVQKMVADLGQQVGGPDGLERWVKHQDILDGGSYGISPATGEFVAADAAYRDPATLASMRADIREKRIPGLKTDEQVSAALALVDQRVEQDTAEAVGRAQKLPGWKAAKAAVGADAPDAKVYEYWKSHPALWEQAISAFRKVAGGAVGLVEQAFAGADLWVRDKANAVAEWSGADFLKTSPEKFGEILADLVSPEKSIAGKVGGRNERLDTGFIPQTADMIGQQLPGWIAAYALSKVPGGKKAAGLVGRAQTVLTGLTYGLQQAASTYDQMFEALAVRDADGKIVNAEEAHRRAFESFNSAFATGLTEIAPLEHVFEKIPLGKFQRLVKVLKETGSETAQELIQQELSNVITTGKSAGSIKADQMGAGDLGSLAAGIALMIAPGVAMKHHSQAKWLRDNAESIAKTTDAADSLATAWRSYAGRVAPTAEAMQLGALSPTDPEIATAIKEVTAARDAVDEAKDLDGTVEALGRLGETLKAHEATLQRFSVEAPRSAALTEAAGQIAAITPERLAQHYISMGADPAAVAAMTPETVQRAKDRAAGVIKTALGRKDLLTKAEEEALQPAADGGKTKGKGKPRELIYDHEGAPIIEERTRQALISLVPATARLFPASEVDRKLAVTEANKAKETAGKREKPAGPGQPGGVGSPPGGGKSPAGPVAPAGVTGAPAAATTPAAPAPLNDAQARAADDLTQFLVKTRGVEPTQAAALVTEFVPTHAPLAQYNRKIHYAGVRTHLIEFARTKGWTLTADNKLVPPAAAPQSTAPPSKPAKPAKPGSSQAKGAEKPKLAAPKSKLAAPTPKDVTTEKIRKVLKDALLGAPPWLGARVRFVDEGGEGTSGIWVDLPTQTLRINPEEVGADLDGMDSKEHEPRLRAQIDEEVTHFLQIVAARRLWQATGAKQEFLPWFKAYYGEMWESEFSPELRDAIVKLRGDTGAAEQPWQLALEGIRMLFQQKNRGEVTEAWRALSRHMPKKLRAVLEAMLSMFREIARSGKGIGERVQREIELLESMLKPGGSIPTPQNEHADGGKSPPGSIPKGENEHGGGKTQYRTFTSSAVADRTTEFEWKDGKGVNAVKMETAKAPDGNPVVAVDMQLSDRGEGGPFVGTFRTLDHAKLHGLQEILRWARSQVDREDLPGNAQPFLKKVIASAEAAIKALAAQRSAENVDSGANDAATSPHNDKPQPTDAQKEVGNYAKGHVKIGGLDISIENPIHSTRSGVSKSGKEWSVTMRAHYGYIRRTEGADGDQVDVFVRAKTPLDYNGPVFVVDQVDPATGKFDEHKAIIGVSSEATAKAMYLAHYEKGWKGLGAITQMSWDEFKAWATSKEAQDPAAPPAKKKRKPLQEELFKEIERREAMKERAKAKAAAKKGAAAQAPPATPTETPEQARLKDAFAKFKSLLPKDDKLSAAPARPNAEFIAAAIELAEALHGAGVRTPPPFIEAMVQNLGEAVTPSLLAQVWSFHPAADPDARIEWTKGLEVMRRKVAPAALPDSKVETQGSETEVDSPQRRAADEILTRLLAPDAKPLDWRGLFAIADRAWGGTQAEGKYTVKDAYDALELAVNMAVLQTSRGVGQDVPDAVNEVRRLESLLKLIPTQSKRTEEQDRLQQFSTPPHFAFVANWVADVRRDDVMLEPSAGIGGLAVFAKAVGAKVIVNEISPRRRAFLAELGFPTILGENAEHLHAILGAKIGRLEMPRPTVVVMNPPFSNAAASGKTGDTRIGAHHVEEALRLLAPGGRLVAIVGEGMGMDAHTFRAWWKQIEARYSVRANIHVDGSNYAKYGTSFSNRLLVIDKSGPTPADRAPLTAEVATIEELPTLLQGIRNDRRLESTEPAAAQPGGGSSVEGVGTGSVGDSSSPAGGGSPDAEAPGGTPGAAAGGRGGSTGRPARGSKSGDGKVGGTTAQAGSPDGTDVAGSSGHADQRPSESGSDRVEAGEISIQAAARPREVQSEDDVFAIYRPAKLSVPGSKPHPAKLVESAAMASVEPPDPRYTPNLPKASIEAGRPSEVQLEAVVYAGQAHQTLLPSGERKGFFIGDGTGVGKGIEIAAIILDNWRQGRRKAVWVSAAPGLLQAAKRDAADVGLDPATIISINGTKASDPIGLDEGVIFSTYSTLKNGHQGMDADGKLIAPPPNAKAKQSRIQQLAQWLGKDFDGVIMFDEAHKAGNAIAMPGKRGMLKPSATGIAVVDLQRLLPKARVVYVSATGATELSNLSYADRLGLWGPGTNFSNKKEFFTNLSVAGLSGMEIVARDMKALGGYLARSISYKGVQFARVTQELTPEQREIYDKLAESWQLVFRNLQEILKDTGAGNSPAARSSASSQFWGAQQRFFNQLLISLQAPALLRDMDAMQAEGHSCVLQLVNTNEAQQERQVAERLSEQEGEDAPDLDDLNVSPLGIILQFVETGFPIHKYEEVADPNDPEKTAWVVVKDSAGNPVIDPEAVRRRDELLAHLSLLKVPDSIMNQVLDKYGWEAIAEITGRTQRLVWMKQPNGEMKRVVQGRSEANRRSEAQEFQDGKRRILIFSDAGGTGFSFHADQRAKNQSLRVHYVVQPGWRANNAMQGLGRSHRSNQAQPPFFKLVETNIRGHKRFISTIARRLAQLGALTTGERKSTGQGLFSEADNLESEYASRALYRLVNDVYHGRVEGWDINNFARELGFGYDRINPKTGEEEFYNKLVDPNTGALNRDNLPTIPQFLNRLLGLTLDRQNDLFEKFDQRHQTVIDIAKANGDYDPGTQNYEATVRGLLSLKVLGDEVVYEHESSTAKTRMVEVAVESKVHPNKFSDLRFLGQEEVKHFIRNIRSGRIYALKDGPEHTDEDTGAVTRTWRRVGVRSIDLQPRTEITKDKYESIPLDQAEAIWDAEYAAAPKSDTDIKHFLVGALVPIWDRLQLPKINVYRFHPENAPGELGVLVPEKELPGVRARLGAGKALTPADAFAAVLEHGNKLGLANGWMVQRVRVSGSLRIEVRGLSSQNISEFTGYIGGFPERINFETRFFLPTDPEKGVKAMERLLGKSPVATLDGQALFSASLRASAAARPPSTPVDVGTWAETPLKWVGIPESALNRGTVALAKSLGRLGAKGAGAVRLTDVAARMANTTPGKVLGQAVALARKELAPHTLLAREAAAWIQETRSAIAWAAHSGEELSSVLKAGGKSRFQDFFVPEAATRPDVQTSMAKFFRGDIKIDALPEDVRPLARRISQLWYERGQAMVDAGIMRLDTFLDRHREGYFPHMVLENEEARQGLRWLGRTLKMGLERVKPQLSTAWWIAERNPVTGFPVNDPYGVPKLVTWNGKDWRFRSEQHRDEWFNAFIRQQVVDKVRAQGIDFDLSALDALELQSPETQALVSAIEGDLRLRYHLGKPQELDRLNVITNLAYVVPKSLAQMDHDIALAKLFAKLSEDSRFVADAPIAGFKEMPKDPRWGKLAGKWVEDAVAQQLMELGEAPELAWQIYDRALGVWKEWRVVYNPGTHFRNVLGNLFFADLAGTGIQNPANWPLYWDAIKALKGQLPEASLPELYQSGILGGDYATQELHSALADVRVPTDTDVSPLHMIMRAPWKAVKKAGRFAHKAYGFEDEIFKVAAYLKAIRSGMPAQEAVRFVRTWFPFYDQIGRSSTLRTVKRLSSPFLSFMQEALRIGGRAVAEKPITFAKWMAIPSLLSLISRAAMGMDDDDWEAVKGNMRGQVAGQPVFSALLPWLDGQGRPAQWDFSNVIPYADMLGKRMERDKDAPLWSTMIQKYFLSGPLTQLAVAWGFGYDPFQFRPFKQPDMTSAEVLGEQARYTGGLILPPLTPGVGTADPLKIVAAPMVQGRFLEQRSVGQEVSRKLFGLDVRSALPGLYESAERWREKEGLPEAPEFKESTLRSRTRRAVYEALVNNDAEQLADALQTLRSRTQDNIESVQDVNRLFFHRDPAAVIHRKDDRERWERSLSPIEKESLQRAREAFEKAKRNAPALIREAQRRRPELRLPVQRKTASNIIPLSAVLPS